MCPHKTKNVKYQFLPYVFWLVYKNVQVQIYRPDVWFSLDPNNFADLHRVNKEVTLDTAIVPVV